MHLGSFKMLSFFLLFSPSLQDLFPNKLFALCNFLRLLFYLFSFFLSFFFAKTVCRSCSCVAYSSFSCFSCSSSIFCWRSLSFFFSFDAFLEEAALPNFCASSSCLKPRVKQLLRHLPFLLHLSSSSFSLWKHYYLL